ncbi:MAG: pseudouridine-5'-phosphate glycosidase [Pseudopedobacter sp.]|nr:pseudouridine-5'-phosphate glycosidase [Deinococcales bacterium]
MNIHPSLSIAPEIQDALEHHLPIVALESTIISHGMPHPQNLEMARDVETLVRENGAVPASIAVMDGKIRVGLSAAQLERLATESGVLKVSRRDLGFALARGRTGATTVAATLLGAHRAGIRIFATGGLGGVHRGVEHTLDISADLPELAQTPVAVVCAGVKSILDIGRTLEYLETAGVPVLGFQTEDFPAFYTRSSGLKVAHRMESAAEVAALLREHWKLGLNSGVVIANPVPLESAMPEVEISSAIESALEVVSARGITGKDITPFLLGFIVQATGGRSLETNIALVKNNAVVAARVARALGGLPGAER